MGFENLQGFGINSSKSCEFLSHETKKASKQGPTKGAFRVELVQIIDAGHGLVKLADVADWDQLEKGFVATFCPDNGVQR